MEAVILHQQQHHRQQAMIAKLIHTTVQLHAAKGGSKQAFLRELDRFIRHDPLGGGAFDQLDDDGRRNAMIDQVLSIGGRWARVPA